MRKIVFTMIAGLVSAIFLVAFLAPASLARTVVFSSGNPGSTWHSDGLALSNVWQKYIPDFEIRHIPGAGVSNLMNVDTGKADIGMSPSITIGDALMGQSPFKEKRCNFSGLLNMYTGHLSFPVWKDSSIYSFSDLKGKRISPGQKGYTIEGLIRQLLQGVGLDYDDMTKVEFIPTNHAAELMKDGHLDAIGKGDTKSSAFLMDLSAQRPIRLLEVPDAVFDALKARSPGIYRVIIPKGAYNGIDKDVFTIGYRQGLIVNPKLPEDLVYKMTKTMTENWVSDMHPVAKLFSLVEPEELALPVGVEPHPGSLKYFKERGWIK